MKPSAPLAIAILGLALLPTVASGAASDTVDYGTNAAIAWNAGYTGEGQTVAVIDSGTDARHPWFHGQVASEACFTGPAQGVWRPTCPGLGTTAEDVLQSGPMFGPGAAAPPRWGWNITASGWDAAKSYHGTHVAGVVAGSPSWLLGFRIGRRGIAPDANLLAINAFSVNADGEGGGGRAKDVAAALRWVNAQRDTHRIAAVNLSWSNSESAGNEDRLCRDAKALAASGHSETRDAINELVANGIPVVAASGNDGGTRVGFPACLPNVIAVGAINTDTGDVSASTPSSKQIAVLAPGTSIVGPRLDATIESANGSSYAAPMISAAIAMFKQKYPDATPSMIRGRLNKTGEKVAVGPGITRRALRVDQFLGIKPAPTGKVNTSCIHLEFQAADNVSHKHDAFARLTCAPTATAPSKLVVRVAGPQIDESREYTNIPIAEPSYYANSLVRFGVPRFDSDPGSYRTCYTLYGTQDQLWPIASDCREDTVG